MELHTPESLLEVHGLDLRAYRRRTLTDWLRQLWLRWQEAGRLRRDYELLMAKTDRELLDIGLSRSEVVAHFKFGYLPERRGGEG